MPADKDRDDAIAVEDVESVTYSFPPSWSHEAGCKRAGYPHRSCQHKKRIGGFRSLNLSAALRLFPALGDIEQLRFGSKYLPIGAPFACASNLPPVDPAIDICMGASRNTRCFTRCDPGIPPSFFSQLTEASQIRVSDLLPIKVDPVHVVDEPALERRRIYNSDQALHGKTPARQDAFIDEVRNRLPAFSHQLCYLMGCEFIGLLAGGWPPVSSEQEFDAVFRAPECCSNLFQAQFA
jgi:hypothetical protein